MVLLAISWNSSSQLAQTVSGQTKPITITIERKNGQLLYGVESKQTKPEEMLKVLSELLQNHGRECPVVGLVDRNAKVMDLDLVFELASKTGFTNISTYIVNKETGKMAQIKFETVVPISINRQTN